MSANDMILRNVERWLERYGRAWVERDPEQAAALFSAAAEYVETPFASPFAGRDAIREYWSEVPRAQADIAFESRVVGVHGATAVAHWRAAFTRIASGKRVELDGVFLLAFDAEGACTSLREWWHRRELEAGA